MANTGKIILFRVQDLLRGNGGKSAGVSPNINPQFANPYYPSIVPPQAWPFMRPGQKQEIGAFNADLEATSKQEYRILGKNYKLNEGDLESVFYSEFKPRGQVGLPVYGDLGLTKMINYFESVELKFENDSAFDTIQFKFIDKEKLNAFFKSAGLAPESPQSDVELYELQVLFDESAYANPDPLPDGYEYSYNYGFLNHNLSVSWPLTGDVTQGVMEQYGITDSIKIKPIYNYYLEKYENFYDKSSFLSLGEEIEIPSNLSVYAQNNTIEVALSEEKAIPNFYYLLTLLSSPEKLASITENPEWNGAAPFSIEGLLKSIIPTNNQALTNATALSPELTTEVIHRELTSEFERNSVVVVTPSFYKNLSNEIKTQKLRHPFYNEIQIPITKGGTVFRDLFKKAKMYEQLQYRAAVQIKIINKALRGPAGEPGTPSLSMDDIGSEYNLFYTEAAASDTGLTVKYKSAPASLYNSKIPYIETDNPKLIEYEIEINEEGQNYDFKNLNSENSLFIDFENYVSHNMHVPTPQGKIDGTGLNFNMFNRPVQFSFIQDVTNPLTFYANDLESENNYIGSVIQNQANSILEYIFNKAKLNAASVFNNLQNYSEILFYEVQKIRPSTEEVIQTFILPNDPDIGNFVSYIDTQIKYGAGYNYAIYAHTISIGNKLTRFNAAPQSLADLAESPGVSFDYKNEYDIKIIRVPYYGTKQYPYKPPVVNISDPPIPPNVTFYPFKNVSDKIGFWFNIGLGEIKMKPELNLSQDLIVGGESITSWAYQLISKQLSAGTISLLDAINQKALFKTDDFGGKIKIYRTTELPKQYSDFKNSALEMVDVIGPRTLIDDIIPNQDYYYTFVHIDVHGQPSNPTPVYHIKMINSDSSKESNSVRIGPEAAQPILFSEIIYLNGDSYESEKVEKSFKKYLLLEPTLAQTYLSFGNFENNGIDSVFSTASDIKSNQSDLKIGKGGDGFISVGGKKFKIRVTSKQTGRKIDLNVDFKNLSVIENYKE